MIQSYTWFADVNECITGEHNCDAKERDCNNTEGSFECTCKPGYSGNGVDCTGNYILVKTWIVLMLTLRRTRKFKPPHRGTKAGGGGGGWNPFPEFLICCSISKRFYLKWSAFDILKKMRYILWIVVLLEACDVTNNDRHLGFYQE